MKILIVRFKQIGDSILSSVICNTLKKSFPKSGIDYVVYEHIVPLFENHPYIDNIIPITKIEYPEISGREALKLSMKITDGYKWDIFLLGLSFIGWIILCVLTLGIGFLWLSSYIDTAYCILYLKLKRNRIKLFEELDSEKEIYL